VCVFSLCGGVLGKGGESVRFAITICFFFNINEKRERERREFNSTISHHEYYSRWNHHIRKTMYRHFLKIRTNRAIERIDNNSYDEDSHIHTH
jgi:hypothetical protein